MSDLEQPANNPHERWKRGHEEAKALLAELAFRPSSSLTQESQERIRNNVVEDLIEEIERGEQ